MEQWRIQRVYCPGGGVMKSALSAAWGRVRKGDITPAGLGPVGPSPGTFLIIGCKWCILNPFFAEFVLISPQKFCVKVAFKAPIYVMRENFHLRFRGSNKAQEGIFISSRRIVGGSGSPRKFLINGCK